jgi:hypothetical protein
MSGRSGTVASKPGATRPAGGAMPQPYHATRFFDWTVIAATTTIPLPRDPGIVPASKLEEPCNVSYAPS